MNDLILANGITMTSLEVVDLVNKLRLEEGNSKVKRHDHFMSSIRDEIKALETLGIGVPNFWESSYINSQNKEQPCFILNKAGVMQMLNKESAYVRYKTQQYIEALENKLATPSYMIEDPIARAEKWIEEQKEKLLLIEEKKFLETKIEDMVDTNVSYETLRRQLKANVDVICKLRKNFKTPWSELYKFLFENGYNLESRRTRFKKRIFEQTEILGKQIEDLKENVIYELEKEIKNYKRNTIEYKSTREQINNAKEEVKRLQAENRKLLSEFNNSNKLDFIKEEEWKDIIIITRSWVEANGVDWREGLSRNNDNLPF